MAKNKAKVTASVDEIEQAIRKAIAAVPGINTLAEEVYCDRVMEAMDLINDGLSMRADELKEVDEDE